jgi:hypothetical protein
VLKTIEDIRESDETVLLIVELWRLFITTVLVAMIAACFIMVKDLEVILHG